MKIWNAIILLITTIAMTSCFNTSDELWIESDGSGRFETTTDLSSVYPFLMMGIDQEMNKAKDGEATEESKNKGKEMVENLLMSDDVDTTFNIQKLLNSQLVKEGKSMDDFWLEMEQNISKEEDMPEAQKETVMAMLATVLEMQFRMQASKTDQLLKTTLKQSFSSINELSNLGKDMMEVMPYIDSEKANNMSADQMAGMDQLFNSFANIDLTGNTLRIRRSGLDLTTMGGEAAQVAPMLGMFLGEQPYRLVIHLPGKVKKISEGVEKIDKRTVAVEMPVSDLFDPEKSIDFEIQFKGLK